MKSMHIQTKFIKNVSLLMCFFVIFFLIFWFILINQPYTSTIATYFHPVLYFPREILFLFLTFLSISALFIHKKLGILFIIIYNSLLFSQLDFNLSLFNNEKFIPSHTDKSIEVVSLNLGGAYSGIDSDRLKRWMKTKNKLFVIATQEAHESYVRKLLNNNWTIKCVQSLCLASRAPIKLIQSSSRRAFGGWGTFVAHFQIKISHHTINIFNVHFETIRKGIEPLIEAKLRANYTELKSNYLKRIMEAQITKKLVQQHINTIILGDFNTVNISPLYKHFWGKYKNAFNLSGNGIEYSKKSKWLGLRIDHILTTKNFTLTNYQAGPFFNGDHRPISTRISYRTN